MRFRFLTCLGLCLGLSVPAARAGIAPDLAPAAEAVALVQSADPAARFLGSAFLWGGEAGIAVTNAHVAGEGESLRLVWPDGREEIARVIARDAVRDVAVLAVAASGGGLLPAPDAPVIGQEVWAIGAPLGIAGTVTGGQISALSRQVDPAAPVTYLQHDAAVNPGSSGGPLVDGQGRLLGMNSRIADGSRLFVGIAYALPSDELSRIVEGLIAETLAPQPRLGLRLRAVDRRIAAALGLPEVAGLLVDAAEPGAAGAKAGVMGGDVLLSLGDHLLASPGDLAFALEAAQGGAGLPALRIQRGEEVIDLTLAGLWPDEEDGLFRQVGGKPDRITSYDLPGLGLTLDKAGRVAALAETSPAARAGMAEGDLVLRLNGQEAADLDLGAYQVTGPLLVLLQSATGSTRHVLIDPWNPDGNAPRALGGANALDPAVIVF